MDEELQEHIDELVNIYGTLRGLKRIVREGYLLHGSPKKDIKKLKPKRPQPPPGEPEKPKKVSATPYPLYAWFFAIHPDSEDLPPEGFEGEKFEYSTALSMDSKGKWRFEVTEDIKNHLSPGWVHIVSKKGFKKRRERKDNKEPMEYISEEEAKILAKVKVTPEEFPKPIKRIEE